MLVAPGGSCITELLKNALFRALGSLRSWSQHKAGDQYESTQDDLESRGIRVNGRSRQVVCDEQATEDDYEHLRRAHAGFRGRSISTRWCIRSENETRGNQ